MNRSFTRKARHALCVAACLALPAAAAAPEQTFADPEQAVRALVSATRSNQATALERLFGPGGEPLVASGDRVADRAAHARFVQHYDQGHRIVRDGPDHATLLLGAEDWPFPIPLVRDGAVWRFDTEAGVQQVLERRIGRNELNAIAVCRAFVQAEREYRAGDGHGQYARRFLSHPGQHDGLYWKVAAGAAPSPMGPLVAAAQAEGYGGEPPEHARQPYHGYFYRILLAQGAAAPGGARDYLVGGALRGGFALLAWPARWGDSGVQTFVVNQDGIVFENNLGADTAHAAAAITAFDPDPGWRIP
jgi:hypothetical protein